MSSNAIGHFGDASFSGRSPGYAAARDGLRSFDGLTAAIRARQDSIGRAASVTARSYPGPTAGSALAGAFAAYAASDSGRAKLEGFANAAAGFLGRLFGAAGGAEQLRLPLEG